jgi:AcrR family transcriptional regulator
MAEIGGQGGLGEGLRERKRRETLRRIVDAGTRLFIAHGYEATTLDAIAAEAGISRRTFFYYFKSKDEILLSMQGGLGDMLAAALSVEPLDRRPIDAVRQAMVKIGAAYNPEEMLILDRLMRSSQAVQARKQASYVQHEATLFAALRRRWPEPARETALRLVAMLSIGALRVSLDNFYREGGKRQIASLLEEAFDALEREI